MFKLYLLSKDNAEVYVTMTELTLTFVKMC